MNVLLAAGGTAGHINPAIAIANTIREYDPTAQITFVGTKRGMENKLVTTAGYEIRHVEIRGLKRSLSLSNLKTAYYVLTAPAKAKKLIRELRPDIVIGTGGYVCWPTLKAASELGIPTALHESNAIPGKAVKMLEKKVDRIYVNFSESADGLSEKEKILHVGNPLISAPDVGTVSDLYERLGIPKTAKKVLLSFGGSLGAQRVNEEVLALMEAYTSKDPEIFHIHATGKYDYENFLAAAKEKGLDRRENLRIEQYIYDMPLWELAADAVICRAGAMTLSEMALLRRACILIPSPNVVNNHQYENAKRLADAGAAIMLEEKHMTPGTLEEAVRTLLCDKSKAEAMQHAIAAFANPDAKQDILRDLLTLIKQ
ncbi:MAG: undecaprenyldiphospho-muramoylpentapeptide beta-N-acetylglucosaminyltransferase [Clostridia bacterium]|nr:undecaprenyldiphospho-muramoylpentapeptide beta-N-acetylglucosaminyltransferase [Clostridia bacterium]